MEGCGHEGSDTKCLPVMPQPGMPQLCVATWAECEGVECELVERQQVLRALRATLPKEKGPSGPYAFW